MQHHRTSAWVQWRARGASASAALLILWVGVATSARAASPSTEASPATESSGAALSPIDLVATDAAPVRVRAGVAPPSVRPSTTASTVSTESLFADDIDPVTVFGGPGLTMEWATIDGGGITFATGVGPGGTFELAGSIGQPDAGSADGGGYALAGGFFGRVAAPADCQGDANNDGVVNFSDVTTVLANWGDFGAAGDTNNDWIVNFSDIATVLANFGAACS
jgi:hypothetical protein